MKNTTTIQQPSPSGGGAAAGVAARTLAPSSAADDTPLILLAANLGCDPEALKKATRLNAAGEIASPATLAKALGVERTVIDDAVRGLQDDFWDRDAPEPGSPVGRVLAALCVAGDRRFTGPAEPNRELQSFASGLDLDLEAVGRMAELSVDDWLGGLARPGRRADIPVAVACCHVMRLALASVRRSAEYAAGARAWDRATDDRVRFGGDLSEDQAPE